jgi:hypothetical protein
MTAQQQETSAAANRPASGLDTISTYVPTSQSGVVVDTFKALNRQSMAILNKVRACLPAWWFSLYFDAAL